MTLHAAKGLEFHGRVPGGARGGGVPTPARPRRRARSSRRSGGSRTSASPARSGGCSCRTPGERATWGGGGMSVPSHGSCSRSRRSSWSGRSSPAGRRLRRAILTRTSCSGERGSRFGAGDPRGRRRAIGRGAGGRARRRTGSRSGRRVTSAAEAGGVRRRRRRRGHWGPQPMSGGPRGGVVPPRPIVPGERRYRDGDRIRHVRWGDGIVVTSKLTRDDEEVTVAFGDPWWAARRCWRASRTSR